MKEEKTGTTHVTPAGGNIFADLDIPDAEGEKERLIMLASIKSRIILENLHEEADFGPVVGKEVL